MKKRKGHKRRSVKRKSHAMPAASVSHQREPSRGETPERKDLPVTGVKKEVSKRADSGGFAPKRYFIIARQFLSDAKVELKKVTWPTRKELLSTTVIVIVLVLLIAFFLGIVDLGLVKIIKNVIR
jgi:preprotein translocase subunit SecE